MLKIYRADQSLKGARLIKKSIAGCVYQLRNGDYFKSFDASMVSILNRCVGLEDKIMNAEPIPNVPEIIIPSAGVYDEFNQFVGFVTPPAPGKDFNSYDENYTLAQRADLQAYSKLFYNLTDVVKRANEQGIVFPDMCTCDNMFVSNGKIHFIDYDGIQVGKYKAPAMSTTLGPEFQYHNSKYMSNNYYFTPELDKKSIVLLYFLSTYNLDLSKVGQRNPFTGKIITLEEVFDMLGLHDYDFMQKVYNTLSQKKPGEYIGDDVMRIAEQYDMQAYGPIDGQHYLKKLKRK